MLARRAAVLLFTLAVAACSKPQKYTSTVEVVQTQIFGSVEQGAPSVMDLDLVYAECPGRQRAVIRGDKTFAACAMKFKKGDRLPAEMRLSWRADRGEYRNELVKVGDCERVVDPKDDASYEVVEQCADLKVNGVVTGVHCDRTRSPELVAKCPWLRRK